MTRKRVCPLCHGVVTPLPHSREDPDVVLARHLETHKEKP